MPHFHLKKLNWIKDFRIAINRKGETVIYIICTWDRCSVCGFIKNPVNVECTGDPKWVMVY